MTQYSKEMIRDLIDGRLPLEEVTRMQQEKDADRTSRVIEVEQERVPWDEPIHSSSASMGSHGVVGI